MIPVQQTKTGPLRGNCLAACVASIFEMPICAVPELEPGTWSMKLRDWLMWNSFGFVYLESGGKIAAQAPAGYAILCLDRATGGQHCMVTFNGEIVWDPWPGEHTPPCHDDKKAWIVFTALNPSQLVKKQ